MRFVFRYACYCVLLVKTGGILCAQPALSDNSLIYSTEGTLNPGTDSSQLFVIRDISIAGNKKTKASTVLRELSFQAGEEYPLTVIVEKFYETRKQLMNTGLFRNVIVSLKSLKGYDVFVKIEVEEKWYIYPLPFLRAVDKSFHEWWAEKDRSLSRVNYGIKITHNNFTGRNDKLDLKFMNGYTKEVSLQYYGLYLDKKLQWSTNMGVGFGMNKEVNYETLDDKQVPFKSSDFLYSFVHSFFEITYRPAIKTRHTFSVGYNYDNLADTIFKLNPHFSNAKSIVRYFNFAYRLSYFDVDYIPYPTKGYAAELTLRKLGFNDPINLWQLTAKGSGTWPAGDKYFFNLRAVGMLKLPFNQPYMTRQFIGYEDQYIQGYEYFVIDGVAGGYAKAVLTRPLLSTHIGLHSKKIKQLNDIPFKLYAKTFVNAGYIYNPDPGQNALSNKMLYSAGIGLDIVANNDFILKIEWTFNQLGQNGLYLHRINHF